jgi:hypothetical protein
VVVFRDFYGNKWDLIESRMREPEANAGDTAATGP